MFTMAAIRGSCSVMYAIVHMLNVEYDHFPMLLSLYNAIIIEGGLSECARVSSTISEEWC